MVGRMEDAVVGVSRGHFVKARYKDLLQKNSKIALNVTFIVRSEMKSIPISSYQQV
jgi:hypothetical protein